MRVAVSRNARGTTGYRAPELIKDEQIFTRKVDIWAVGCIFYEIVTRRKAFRDDLETRDYQPSKYPIKFPELDFHYGNSRQFFPETVKKTLRLEFADRPSADRLLESFRDFDGHLFTAPKRVSSTAPKPPLGPKSSRGKIHPPIISKTQLSPLGNSALAYQPLPIAMPVGSAPRSNFHHDAMSPMQNIAIISPLPPFGSSSALPLPTPYVPAMPNVRVPSPFPTMSSPSGLGSVDPSLHIQNTFWPQH
jgi:serine/threonine protein kinase